MTDPTPEEPHLLELILIFQQSAWFGLGKIQNPESGKTNVSLPHASHAIEMLAMLERKTRGNLTEQESKFLANALTQLRLNYVEVAAETASTRADQGDPSKPADSFRPSDPPKS